jgi:excinuclease UvrABC nuclease subunit
MIGPLDMTLDLVSAVPAKPGAYILGSQENRALYVGRADADLRAQLLAHWNPLPQGSTIVPVHKFWYQVATNWWDAYALECRWYHQFAPIHNASHPVRPLGAPAGCPVCGR